MKEHTWNILGIMSGTSLDGIDLALVSFKKKENLWDYSILQSKGFEYSDSTILKLKNAHKLSGLELSLLNNEIGNIFAECVTEFNTPFPIDYIASHGHTIFHQPHNGITLQIGNGAVIASKTGVKTICDFRSTDVANKGQGAPLVPIGDLELFNKYDACINLGGFSNISFTKDNERIAFDVCPVNTVLNKIASELGHPYDDKGKIAKSGTFNEQLFNSLNELEYYQQLAPKSLGIEWVEKTIYPLIKNYEATSILQTFSQHIAFQIAKVINTNGLKKILLTGGGVFNNYLIHLIKNQTSATIFIPSKELIEYKEALIFAFLGLKRILNQPNTLASVTGAKKDSVGGCIYLP